MPEPLDLPAGPLVQHLQAAHALLRYVLHLGQIDASEVLETHAHHMRAAAAYTATTSGLHFPPAPTDDEGGLPDGWTRIVYGTDGRALCGVYRGAFIQYAPTEDVVTALFDALQEAHRG